MAFVTGTAPSRRQPRFVTVAAVMRHLSVSRTTVLAWIHSGALPAVATQSVHYADDRPRKGRVGHWRIAVDDYEAFLVQFRAGLVGKRVPKAPCGATK